MTLWRTLDLGPETDSEDQPDRRTIFARRCLQLALVLLIVGLVPGILALWSQRRAAAAVVWRDPADNIQVAAIAPDLALLSLAGVPDDQALALAMEKGELATVHAVLALSTELSDAQRTNGWLWLAFRYQQTDDSHRATQAYRLAGLGAIMGTNVPDLLRTETLLAVGRGLIELHDQTSARFYLKQTAIIAAHSAHLKPYHRHSLLERLVPSSLRAGGERDDWKTLSKTIKSGAAEPGSIANSGIAGRVEWWDVPPVNDAALAQAQDTRRTVAAEHLQAMITKPGAADGASPGGTHQDAEQALRSALLAEDAAVERYVEQRGGAQGTERSAQQVLLRWLALKRRISAGGFGPGLVPEWESNRDGIDAALNAAWADWLALETDASAAIITGAVQTLPSDAGREAMIAAYWGLYPDASLDDLVSATQSGSGFGRLRLTILEPGTPPGVGWSE